MFSKLALPKDKANHAFYGLLIYCVFGLISINAGLWAVYVFAILKEVYDEVTYGGADVIDAVITILPATVLFILAIFI